MIRIYSNQDEARKYVLKEMNERYGESFVILEKEKYKSYPIYGDVYVCEVAPEWDVEKSTIVRVTQRGELSDGWAAYLFSDEIIEKARKTLIETEDITIKSITPKSPATQRLWTKEDGKEEYLQGSGVYLKIVAACPKGLEIKEYAELIGKFLEPVYNLELDSEVSVKIGKAYIFFGNISVRGGVKTEPYTVEELEKIVEERMDSTPFPEDLY